MSANQLDAFKKKLDQALEAGKRLYITTPAVYSHDREKQFSNYLKTYFHMIPLGRHFYEDWPLESMSLQVHQFYPYRLEPES